MQSDSDTESEHECSIEPRLGCKDGVINGLTSSRSESSTFNGGKNASRHEQLVRNQDSLLAVEQIKSVDLTVHQDIDTRDGIHEAYTAIVRFLDDACTLPLHRSRSAEVLSVFAHLVDENFLSILFSHRQAFQNIIHTPIDATSSSVICLLDVVLAKLGLLVLNVTGGFSPNLQAPFLESMRLHREEDAVRAAAQLPEKWQSMSNIIASNEASPAAQRLALRLLFAAYVIGPQLTARNPWIEASSSTGVRPDILMGSLIRSSNPRSLNGLSISSMHRYDAQEGADRAMIVSLFSACQIAQFKSDADSPSLLTRPQSLGYILDMIQFIMYQPSAGFSWLSQHSLVLDLAQTILVRWGDLVPWSWSLLDGHHIAGLECITHLTITWLYHTHSPFFSTDACPSVTSQLENLVASKEASSCIAILQVLHQINTHLREAYDSRLLEVLSPPLTLVICKSCWATIHLLRLDAKEVQPRVSDFGRCLLTLFCILREAEGELKIKTLVLEALTMVAPQTLAMCVVQVRRDTDLGFNFKLFNAIVRSENALHASSISSHSVLAVKCLVDFLTIMWHSRAEESVCRTNAVSFLRSAITVLKNQGQNSYISLILHDTLLVAFSAFSSNYPLDDVKLMQEWLVRSSLVQSGCSNFIAASGVAHCILANPCDALHCADAWSYLRDVLLLILGRRFAEENEALALLVSPTICLALARMADVDHSVLQFLLSSPWTISLCTELRSLMTLEARKQSIAPYFSALHHRLTPAGDVLLNKITPRPKGIADTECCHSELKLVFCCVYPYSRLILITQT